MEVFPSKDLSAPVNVTRDAHGVPAIEAANSRGLIFRSRLRDGAGPALADGRDAPLWLRENFRRFWARIRSKIDREQRILGLRAAAKKSLGMASPRDRSYFDAYARGVNAFIAAHSNALPIEFRILKYRPKPWQAEDSIVIANQMVKDLNLLHLPGHAWSERRSWPSWDRS